MGSLSLPKSFLCYSTQKKLPQFTWPRTVDGKNECPRLISHVHDQASQDNLAVRQLLAI